MIIQRAGHSFTLRTPRNPLLGKEVSTMSSRFLLMGIRDCQLVARANYLISVKVAPEASELVEILLTARLLISTIISLRPKLI